MLLLSGFVGALIGAALTFGFNMWKFHRDERNSRCDEICKAVWDAATQAADYWATSYKDSNKQKIVEGKLLAAQTLVDGLFADFRHFLSHDHEKRIDERLTELLDVLTGGEYSVLGRPLDIARATRAAPIASEVNVLVRRAHRETMPFHRISLAYHTNRRRTLDMPLRRDGKDWD